MQVNFTTKEIKAKEKNHLLRESVSTMIGIGIGILDHTRNGVRKRVEREMKIGQCLRDR